MEQTGEPPNKMLKKFDHGNQGLRGPEVHQCPLCTRTPFVSLKGLRLHFKSLRRKMCLREPVVVVTDVEDPAA